MGLYDTVEANLPSITTNMTREEFLFGHDQACVIADDAINNKQHKLEMVAKDPQTKRCL